MKPIVAVGPVVRLFVLNESDSVLRQSVQLATADGALKDGRPVGWLPLTVLVPNDGEHEPLFDLKRERGYVTNRERVNRVIECGTEIVDGVADEDADARGRVFRDLRPSNCVARLGVYLTPYGVGIRPEPAVDRVLSGFCVFTAPLDLQPRAV